MLGIAWKVTYHGLHKSPGMGWIYRKARLGQISLPDALGIDEAARRVHQAFPAATDHELADDDGRVFCYGNTI